MLEGAVNERKMSSNVCLMTTQRVDGPRAIDIEYWFEMNVKWAKIGWSHSITHKYNAKTSHIVASRLLTGHWFALEKKTTTTTTTKHTQIVSLTIHSNMWGVDRVREWNKKKTKRNETITVEISSHIEFTLKHEEEKNHTLDTSNSIGLEASRC